MSLLDNDVADVSALQAKCVQLESRIVELESLVSSRELEAKFLRNRMDEYQKLGAAQHELIMKCVGATMANIRSLEDSDTFADNVLIILAAFSEDLSSIKNTFDSLLLPVAADEAFRIPGTAPRPTIVSKPFETFTE